MAHQTTVPIPPGGGSRVAGHADIGGGVTYTAPHGLTAQQERRNIEIIERQTAKFYDKLQARLADPDGVEAHDE